MWFDTLGVTVEELAQHARVSGRTVLRALAGDPIGPRASRALSAITGIDAGVLRTGEGIPPELRAEEAPTS